MNHMEYKVGARGVPFPQQSHMSFSRLALGVDSGDGEDGGGAGDDDDAVDDDDGGGGGLILRMMAMMMMLVVLWIITMMMIMVVVDRGGDLADDGHDDDGQRLLAWVVFPVHRVQCLNILWKFLFSGIHLAPDFRRILGGRV